MQIQAVGACQVLNPHEAETLQQLCAQLLGDARQQVLSFVVHHWDTSLHAGIGESQRKVGIPDQQSLLRKGLALLDDVCQQRYGSEFVKAAFEHQQQLVSELVGGSLSLQQGNNPPFPTSDFVDKLTSETVAAYYSHPLVWSEIGYAGPAYPRGYVRIETGLTDPWEARNNGK